MIDEKLYNRAVKILETWDKETLIQETLHGLKNEELQQFVDENEDDHVCGTCSLCGSDSWFDRESLEASTHDINGIDHVICCPCEDDLAKNVFKIKNWNGCDEDEEDD